MSMWGRGGELFIEALSYIVRSYEGFCAKLDEFDG